MELREITDRYQLQKILKSNRFGTVLRATDLSSGRTVAVKLITVGPSPGLDAAGPPFEKLAAALAGLGAPSLPAVLDSGFTTDGSAFLVLELLEGQGLDTLSGAPPARVLSLIGQALDGLEALAGRGLVHHNVSPDNLFITAGLDGERVVLLGLGTALFRPPGPEGAAGLAAENTRFRAPELAAGAPADSRADLYSLALTTCHALGATIGFGDEPVVQLPLAVSFELESDDALRQVLERCLRQSTGERSTPKEIREALRLAMGAAAPAAPTARNRIDRAVGGPGDPGRLEPRENLPAFARAALRGTGLLPDPCRTASRRQTATSSPRWTTRSSTRSSPCRRRHPGRQGRPPPTPRRRRSSPSSGRAPPPPWTNRRSRPLAAPAGGAGSARGCRGAGRPDGVLAPASAAARRRRGAGPAAGGASEAALQATRGAARGGRRWPWRRQGPQGPPDPARHPPWRAGAAAAGGLPRADALEETLALALERLPADLAKGLKTGDLEVLRNAVEAGTARRRAWPGAPPNSAAPGGSSRPTPRPTPPRHRATRGRRWSGSRTSTPGCRT